MAAKRRKGITEKWVKTRKTVQTLAFLAFLAFFITAKELVWPAEWVNLPLQLDLLAVLAYSLAGKVLLPGAVIALASLLLVLFFGRAWCGWLCPLGTLLDWLPLRHRHPDDRIPSEDLRKVKHILLLVILSAALFGNLTLLVFDPLTLFYRTLTTGIFPAIDQMVTGVEKTLMAFPSLAGWVVRLDGSFRPALLPLVPVVYRGFLGIAAVFLILVGLNWFAPRFWCRYVCPLGSLTGLISRFSLVKRKVGAECKGCSLCVTACPTGTIDPERGYTSDPAECTLCMECLHDCPRGVVSFPARLSLPEPHPYDPGRRDALLTLGFTAIGLALLRSEPDRKIEGSHLLRPPGVNEPDLMSRCVRCSICLRTCPTSALQPALGETGLAGLWTPLLVPRLGYCDYSCNACGQACPTGAIPELLLEEKRTCEMGKAVIEEGRCLAWADHIGCIVCEEMCPLPQKAIWLEEAEFHNREGERLKIQLPHVERELCIGCGICEFKCPVSGEAAIRVYSV